MRLPDDLEREWHEQVAQLEAEQPMEYVSSVERFAMQKGRDEGLREGRDEGRREEAVRLLLRLLTHRFGQVPANVQTRLHVLTLQQTEALVDLVLTCQSLAEFTDHLPVLDATAPGAEFVLLTGEALDD